MLSQNFIIRDFHPTFPIIQGGMGIGYSNYNLAGNVALNNGIGILSSAALDRVVSQRIDKKVNARQACKIEVEDAKKIAQGNGLIGMNIMVATVTQYEDSVLGSLDGGVDIIISGAGLPIKLPSIVAGHPRANQVALIPIVSSGRALKLIIAKWERQGRIPDAVVVEGPLAGGHIGWTNIDETKSKEAQLESLVQEVKEVADTYSIPVIAAGGISNYDDINRFLKMGCKAVQMGTRFLATHESGASNQFKEAIVNSKEKDIILAAKPGSPCGLLFRVIENSPFYQESLQGLRPSKCDKGYVLINGKCAAKDDSTKSFCICNGLLSSSSTVPTQEKQLWTVGAKAHEINQIVSVKELMTELVH